MRGAGCRFTASVLLLVCATHGRAVEPPCGPLRLEDVTEAAGIFFRHDRGTSGAKHLPETMGGGLAWIDFDADGWWDLYLVQSGPFPPRGDLAAENRLYRNQGDGRFVDVTAATHSGDRGCGQGAVAADADGDGDADLYITNFGTDRLLINDGQGRFSDATLAAGLGLDGWSSSAAFADADEDGDLDLYVTRYVEYDPDEPFYCGDPETGRRRYCDPSIFRGAGDRLFRNEGSGRFREDSAAAEILPASGRGLGVVFTDLDGDGLPDLYVANDLDINLLFRNRGDGTFEDVSLVSGAGVNRSGRPEAGMGLAVADVDGDLDPDLTVTNFDVETNTLYRNLGAMTFEDVSAASGFGLPSFNQLAFGIVAEDLDQDQDLDFYIANGHIFEEPRRDNVFFRQRDQVLMGDGAGQFEEIRCEALDRRASVARGLAAVDFDNDGDGDLGVQENGGPFTLLRNGSDRSTWLGVQLHGRIPNTEAVGARLVLTAEESRQVRWLLAGDSYQSSSERRARFSLSGSRMADWLEVSWPSGRKLRLLTPPLGRYLHFREQR